VAQLKFGRGGGRINTAKINDMTKAGLPIQGEGGATDAESFFSEQKGDSRVGGVYGQVKIPLGGTGYESYRAENQLK